MGERFTYAAPPPPPFAVLQRSPELTAYLQQLQAWQSGLVGELERLSAQADAPLAVKYTVANAATRRALDVTTTTLGELREIVGTVITDLQNRGLLSDRGA